MANLASRIENIYMQILITEQFAHPCHVFLNAHWVVLGFAVPELGIRRRRNNAKSNLPVSSRIRPQDR